jgi:hypothetical protein
MQAPGAVNEQEQVQERWAPSRSYSSLELRCAMLEMDMRLEKQRCEEYRRILLALLAMNAGGHHHGQQLPASVPDSERVPVMPLPAGGSSSASGSSVVPTTTIPVPRGATVVPDAGQRHSELPNSFPPLGSSSRLSDGSSRRSIGPTRGGRCRGDLAGAVASSTRYRLVCILFFLAVCSTHIYLPVYRQMQSQRKILSIMMMNLWPPQQFHQYPVDTL